MNRLNHMDKILIDDLLILIIINCSGLSKIMMHYVCKKFKKMTLNNKQNRKLGTSFVSYFVENRWYNIKNRLCSYTAANGYLEILKWVRENGCRLDSRTCTDAAENGHINVLKWARSNNCDWNKDTCANAAYNGHLEIIKWARRNGCVWDEWCCTNAAKNGARLILQQRCKINRSCEKM